MAKSEVESCCELCTGFAGDSLQQLAHDLAVDENDTDSCLSKGTKYIAFSKFICVVKM